MGEAPDVICVPSGITGVEQRAVQEAAQQAGARKEAYIIESRWRPRSAPDFRCTDRPQHDRRHRWRNDRGRGDLAGGIVASESNPHPGDGARRVRSSPFVKRSTPRARRRTSEEIKIALGSAFPLEIELLAEVRGRDLVTGPSEDDRGVDRGDPRCDRRAVAAIVDAVKVTWTRRRPSSRPTSCRTASS